LRILFLVYFYKSW